MSDGMAGAVTEAKVAPAGGHNVAMLAHSMIVLAPTDFTRDVMLGAALVL